MVINLTAQARTFVGTGFYPQAHKKHTTNLLLEGLQQTFDDTLIDEALRVVMHQNNLELKATVFHSCEDTPVESTFRRLCLPPLPP